MRHRRQPDFVAGLLVPLHRSEKRKRAFGFAELPVDAEIGKLARELAPEHVTQIRILLDLPPQRAQIERRPFRAEQIFAYSKAARRHDSLRTNAVLYPTPGH